ncbi:PQQ-binding-like beta-propeller repeat protein [Nonomuraea jiangxiensis]|uniref:Outer membrane protein assembly factor BamB, contains PQQ-like beta-propeller repeat n=1 Tax=Nonomuraea jiangxiensis TaxID=633440 RepID=A0A1G8ESK1_9ACTN|nr:PQQ-binding-like beta-propeller repeat protein [Nonomuraea jiangxiensis]SDH72845.1 Outer membrane protein assembly factor BamB, contains PQQ-like beta-propeller repeat [Nonomuraea jiangxiensis]
MLIIRCLRALTALSVAAAVAVADDGRPPLELVGWKAAWSVPAEDMASLSFLSGENLITAASEGTVTVRDARTGTIRRTIRTSAPSLGDAWATTGTLVVAGSPRGSSDRTLYGYDLASGGPLWQHALPPSGPRADNLPRILVSEYGIVVFQRESGLLSLDVRTGGIHARNADTVGCEGQPDSTSRAVLLLSHCGQGRVRLDSFDPRTLRRNWTRPVATRHTTADDDVRLSLRRASEGFVIAGVDDDEYLFTQDGTPLPVSGLDRAAAWWPSGGDGRWSPPLQVGDLPDAGDPPGFDLNSAWPLPGYLISRDQDTGRLGAFPLDRPLAHTTNLVGATSRMAFIHSDAQVTAFRPVYGRPTGPVALGGVPPHAWPDACSLLTARDLGHGIRPVPGSKSLGDLTLPRPVACDWIPPEDDGEVISLAVSWVSPNAGALFAAAAEQTRRHESFDFDPTIEGEGIFSYTAHGPGGTFGGTLVNVGPVIVHLTSSSRLLQRLTAVRVRDNLMARYRPGERVRPPERTGGWTHLADGSVSADPVVDGDVVYAGADDGLYALDAVNGRARWKSWPAAPMLVDGVLYGVRSDGVAAIDAASGRMRWNRDFDARDIVIKDGGVYAGVGFTHVIALDAVTGKQRWRFRVPGDLGNVAVAAGTVYVSSRKGHVGDQQGLLSALDATTGALRWRSRLGAADFTPAGYLTATGEAVFAVTGTKVSALDPATGKARWRARFGHIVRYDPVVIGGTVYLGDLAGRTYALNTASGKERWRLTTAGDSGRWNVTESRGKVYIGGRHLHALDPETGQERWSRPLTAEVSVHEDTVFARDEGGTLHALDAATGAPRWRFQAGGRFQTQPVVAGGLVYVGSSNGNLYALRAKDGRPGPNPAELDRHTG